MRLRDIVKPCTDIVSAMPALYADMNIMDIPDDFLASAPPTILVGNAGEPLGQIDRDVLVYVKQKYDIAKMVFILDHLEEGIIAVDPDSRIFYANHMYTQLLGVPVGKIIGKRLRDIEANAAINTVLETRKPVISEKIHIHTIGRHVSVRIFPIDIKGRFEGVVSIFKDVTETNKLNREITRVTGIAREYHNQIRAHQQLADLGIVGDDQRFARVVQQAMLVARTEATVLLRGENGTGKEILASLIHSHSARENHPFITVNCAAVPESLIESELFGYADGSFTGAKKGGQAGKLQLADGGTLFLDEVGDMPYSMQGKLLRFLQQGEIERLGGVHARPLDVRVIAATNQPLEEMLLRRQFRRDFYYRLNVFTITIPPLRERGHDLLLLIKHFLAIFNNRYGGSLEMTPEVYRELIEYPWPGNVRELKNYVERSVILSSWADIGQESGTDAAALIYRSESGKEEGMAGSMYPDIDSPVEPIQQSMHSFERTLLVAALRRNGNNRSAAMRELGMSRRTFYRKLAEHDLHDKNGTEVP